MVVNPKAAHNFATVLLKNSKTDVVDANTLAEYSERMNFVAWVRPSNQVLALRCFARRINALTGQKAAAKNHLHALSVTQNTPKALLRDAQLAILQLEKRIDALTTEARALIRKHPELERMLTLLTGIKGIAETSAIALTGELLRAYPIASGSSLPDLIPRRLNPARVCTRRSSSPRRVTAISARPCICQP
jgi:transposase